MEPIAKYRMNITIVITFEFLYANIDPVRAFQFKKIFNIKNPSVVIIT